MNPLLKRAVFFETAMNIRRLDNDEGNGNASCVGGMPYYIGNIHKRIPQETYQLGNGPGSYAGNYNAPSRNYEVVGREPILRF